jgi:hypothetical protein
LRLVADNSTEEDSLRVLEGSAPETPEDAPQDSNEGAGDA